MSDRQSNSTESSAVSYSSFDRNLMIAQTDLERRQRPTTESTPDPKRTKNEMNIDLDVSAPSVSKKDIKYNSAVEMTKATIVSPQTVVAYPTNIAVPSKSAIETLYKAATESDKSSISTQVSSSEAHEQVSTSTPNSENEQVFLNPAGVLSLKEVLLPGLAFEEETAVKRLQAKVQRDAPQYTFVMQQCRRLIRQSVANAIVSVRDTSLKRADTQAERRKQEVLQQRQSLLAMKQTKQEQKTKEAEERQKQRQEQQSRRKVQMTRQHPRNQDFWKEVVFLTSSMAQLEKEERMWAQMEHNLHRMEEETPPSDRGEPRAETAMERSSSILTASKHDLTAETEQKMQDILRASSRIQNRLGDVLTLLEDTEEDRKHFYRKYYQEHYFDGYLAVDNPKKMIRFLSQSQEDFI